jgi:hypothetical protein
MYVFLFNMEYASIGRNTSGKLIQMLFESVRAPKLVRSIWHLLNRLSQRKTVG